VKLPPGAEYAGRRKVVFDVSDVIVDYKYCEPY
jgi:hypothetical protein